MTRRRRSSRGWREALALSIGVVGLAGCLGSADTGRSTGGDDSTDGANRAPVARCGADFATPTGQLASPDGSSSSDPDGDDLSFTWALASQPSGSGAILLDATSAAPSFVPALDGAYLLTLIVCDPWHACAADSVAVQAVSGNIAPLADAGVDRTVEVGDLVTLDASGSSDLNGDSLAFLWSFVAIPATSSVSLSNPSSSAPSFVPDAAGDYVVALVVIDASLQSVADTVTIHAETSSVGAAPISGQVDSSRIDRFGVNEVYIFSGDVIPDDVDGDGGDPVATVPVTQRENSCLWSYTSSALPSGQYTLAFTNGAADDDPSVSDVLTFVGTTTVTLSGASATHDFGPAHLLQVGPTRTYLDVLAATAVAEDGDVIEIDAGIYNDQTVVWRRNNLTIRGIGGRAHMRATAQILYESGNDLANGMGVWVTRGSNITIENIEISGASVADENGAGIRIDGVDLRICNAYLHDNENGVLGGGGDVLIEYSEFANNGFGTGYTHNMYISAATTRLTLRHSYTHHAIVGHTVKSRAQSNYLLYNRIMDEVDGNSSYSIDLPNGGLSYVIGNLVQQGPNTENGTIIAYGLEGLTNPTSELYAVNNTIVNDRSAGTFLAVQSGTTATIANNLFVGTGTVLSGPGTLTTNLTSDGSDLINRTAYDYHLKPGVAAIGAGTVLGSASGFSLDPLFEYVHPAARIQRTEHDSLDVGAYEH